VNSWLIKELALAWHNQALELNKNMAAPKEKKNQN
jgi:hypothetical protein